MTYGIFAGFLADAEACEFCSVLVGGQWIEITDWDDRYAEAGVLWCRAWDGRTAVREGNWFKTLIVLSEIQAVRSDAS